MSTSAEQLLFRDELSEITIPLAIADPKDRHRRKYCEYDPFTAQDKINENNENNGTKMLVTNQMAFLFKKYVLEERLSPYDAICRMKKEMPNQHIPCLSTWYKHINVGDVCVRYGETPYHPKKKPKCPKPHLAMTVLGRLTLNDRPAGAIKRSRFGHYEMDTVVSSTNGKVYTTRVLTPRGKKDPSKTATGSSAGGIQKEPTSESAQLHKCTASKRS